MWRKDLIKRVPLPFIHFSNEDVKVLEHHQVRIKESNEKDGWTNQTFLLVFVFHFSSFSREENFVRGYSNAKYLWFIFSAPVIYSWRKDNDWISIQSTRRNYLTYWSQFPFLSISFPFLSQPLSNVGVQNLPSCFEYFYWDVFLWPRGTWDNLCCLLMRVKEDVIVEQWEKKVGEEILEKDVWLKLFHWLQSEGPKCETQPRKIVWRNFCSVGS